MITQIGENAVGQTLATGLGTHIAIGASSAAPTLNDKELGFEVYRAPITNRSYDPTTNTVTFKATVPDYMAVSIAEVGLISSPHQSLPGGMIATFDDDVETWSVGTFTTNNVRVGGKGLTLAVQNSAYYAGGRVSLADASLSDVIKVAYFGTGGLVNVRLENSDTDYYSFSFSVSAGYNVFSVQVGSLIATGTPDLSAVSGIKLFHTGSGSVTMDAIRISSQTDASDSLVVRQTVATPYVKTAGMPMDIEVPVVVSL